MTTARCRSPASPPTGSACGATWSRRDDSIEVVSGSGALGFYPWIDRVHGTYGIVAVDDELHGAEHAVPASQRIARMLWQAAA